MNTFFHFLINIFIAFILKFSFLEIFLIGLGGILIDIDHIINLIFVQKIYSIKKMVKFCKENYKKHIPHFYFFHTFESIFLLLIISYFLNWYFFLIVFGFLLHFILDILTYICFYKSIYPWIKYYSFIYYKK